MDESQPPGTGEKVTQTESVEGFQQRLNQLLSGDLDGLTNDNYEGLRELAIGGGLRVALVIVLLLVAMTAAGWAAAAVRSSLTRMKFDATLAKFLARLTRWVVLLLGLLACLGTFGVETTSFAAVLGAAGFAVGLALQGTLSNFAAGAMLLLFRPFKVGDVVNLDGAAGVVDEISVFTTMVDTFDNRRIILPNGEVFGSKIENITFHSIRRVDVSVGCAYDADIDRTREALGVAVEETQGKLSDPEPAIVLDGLGASSVDWIVRVWAPTSDYLAVKQSLLRAVKMRLDAAGIGIPFPQLDVHVQPGSMGAA